MIIGTLRCEDGLHIAAVRADRVLDVTAGFQRLRAEAPGRLEQVLEAAGAGQPPSDITDLIAMHGQARVLIDALGEALEAEGLLQATATAAEDAGWGVPVQRPGKIVGVGHNYADLLRDLGREPPPHPILFAKWASTLRGPGEMVPLPPDVHEVSYEAELAVIIGRRGRRIPRERALEHVFGYTIADDVTSIEAIRADVQLVRGKNYDGFTPMGPWIVTADEVPYPQGLAVRLWQNGNLRQNSSTNHMIFSVAELIAFISCVCTLEPGDVILTGSPTGVARLHRPPAHLAPGDEIVIGIEGIGTLRHGVSAPAGSGEGAAVQES